MKKAKLHKYILVFTLMLAEMSTASASPQVFVQDTLWQQQSEIFNPGIIESVIGDDEYIYINAQNTFGNEGGKGDGISGGAKGEGTPDEFTLLNKQSKVDSANNGQGGNNLRNQTRGGIILDDSYAPIGSGCFILMAAGAFYALRKRRKEE